MPVELYVPLLDGKYPATWQIWGKEFKTLCEEFHDGEHSVPKDVRFVEDCRLRIVYEPDEDLFNRKGDEWLTIVGALVAGGGNEADRKAVGDRFVELCTELQSEDAWHRKLQRFHLYVVFEENDPLPYPERLDFAYELHLRAEKYLHHSPTPDLIKNAQAFKDRMQTFEVQLATTAAGSGLLARRA
jgi:hypothetical protein